MISYLLPTRDRPDRLAATLTALGRLSIEAHDPAGGAEVIVVDDASASEPDLPGSLANGLPLRVIRLDRQHGAAARNAGVEAAGGQWIIMLDDDSFPLGETAAVVIAEAPKDVAAIGGEIMLPGDRHEDGGLPEVFIGCGAIVRRDAFLSVGGYDKAFHYYAEEYDLCAKLMMDGWRIIHDWRYRVRHEKVAHGRNMNTILGRLVRNNGWVMQRYAPNEHLESSLTKIIERYELIARKEGAVIGYQHGLDELTATLDQQTRRPMTDALWDRFTGLTHARASLRSELDLRAGNFAIVEEGKNAHIIGQALEEIGARTADDPAQADVLVIGTLSPGPIVDAWLRRSAEDDRPVLPPWMPEHADIRRSQRIRAALLTGR